MQIYEVTPSGESTVRYKACVATRGFPQIEGIDFSETYALVVKFKSVRLILFRVAVLDYNLHQMDVKNAFLNVNINESVYMEQPEGFIQQGNEYLVFHFKKAI